MYISNQVILPGMSFQTCCISVTSPATVICPANQLVVEALRWWMVKAPWKMLRGRSSKVQSVENGHTEPICFIGGSKNCSISWRILIFADEYLTWWISLRNHAFNPLTFHHQNTIVHQTIDKWFNGCWHVLSTSCNLWINLPAQQ